MTVPWDTDPHYVARLAAYAAELRGFFGEVLAVRGISASVGGYIRTPDDVADSVLSSAGATPAEIEDQIAVVARVQQPALRQAVAVLHGSFNLLEDLGRRPVSDGAIERHAYVAILPPYPRPTGWPSSGSGTLGYPNTFTIEIVTYPAGFDLGRTFVPRWTRQPGSGLWFREVDEIE